MTNDEVTNLYTALTRAIPLLPSDDAAVILRAVVHGAVSAARLADMETRIQQATLSGVGTQVLDLAASVTAVTNEVATLSHDVNETLEVHTTELTQLRDAQSDMSDVVDSLADELAGLQVDLGFKEAEEEDAEDTRVETGPPVPVEREVILKNGRSTRSVAQTQTTYVNGNAAVKDPEDRVRRALWRLPRKPEPDFSGFEKD